MRLDLNLLAVLEGIMLERNVTRAARNLAMSQPAVSNALRRARTLLSDELFIKVTEGVRPTQRMEAIWPDLHGSLQTLRAALAFHEFDPRSAATHFRLAITDSLAADTVHAIILTLRAEAPHARVAFVNHTNAGSLEGIERGTLDCAVGMFPVLPRGLKVAGLRTDRYVGVMRPEHPLASGMSLDQFVDAPHVLVTPSGQEMGVVDGWLSLRGRTRNIVAIVNHFSDALRIVAESDVLTCVPQGFLDTSASRLVRDRALQVRALPFEAEPLLYKLVWHDRVDRSLAHQWFRTLVIEICGRLPPAPLEPARTP